MSSLINSFLQFLRVTDERSQLSLTNISVLGVLVKILLQSFGGGSSTSSADLIALGIVLANYTAKRLIQIFEDKNKKPEASLETLTASVTSLQEELAIQKNRLSSLALVAGMKPQPPPRGMLG